MKIGYKIEVVDFSLNEDSALSEKYRIYREVMDAWKTHIDRFESKRSELAAEDEVYLIDIQQAVEFLEESVNSENEIDVASEMLRGKAVMEFYDDSNYFPVEYLEYKATLSGETRLDLGADFHISPGEGVLVDNIIQGGVIDRLTDVRVGDRLLEVNGTRLGVNQLISGQDFSALFINQPRVFELLKLARNGKELVVQIAPEETVDPYLYHYFIEENNLKVSYLKLRTFSYNSACKSIKKRLNEHIKRGAEALVLDLRYNPGGEVEVAQCIAGLFLEKDKKIVYSKPVNPKSKEKIENFTSPLFGKRFDLPITILVNAYSASSSEILAGSLAARARALLVGTTTAGKGTIQYSFNSPDVLQGTYLLRTVRTYHFHNDSTSHFHGITPNLIVENKFSEAEAKDRLKFLSVNPVRPNAKKLELFLPHRFDLCVQDSPVSSNIQSTVMTRYFKGDNQLEKALDLSFCQVNDSLENAKFSASRSH